MKKTLLAAIMILGVLCVTMVAIGMADGPKEAAEVKISATPFQGKVTVVSFEGSSYGEVLEKVEFRKIDGKTFLVGVGLDYQHPGNWQKGRTIWIALSSISMITEFPDLETYEEAVGSVEM